MLQRQQPRFSATRLLVSLFMFTAQMLTPTLANAIRARFKNNSAGNLARDTMQNNLVNTNMFVLAGQQDPLESSQPFIVTGGNDTDTFAVIDFAAMPAVGVFFQTSCAKSVCTAAGWNLTNPLPLPPTPLLFLTVDAANTWASPDIKGVTTGLYTKTVCVDTRAEITCMAAGNDQDSQEAKNFAVVSTTAGRTWKRSNINTGFYLTDLSAVANNVGTMFIASGGTNTQQFVAISTDKDLFNSWTMAKINAFNINNTAIVLQNCASTYYAYQATCIFALAKDNINNDQQNPFSNPTLVYGIVGPEVMDIIPVYSRQGNGSYYSISCNGKICLAGGEISPSENVDYAPIIDLSINGGRNWINQSIPGLPTTGSIYATQVIDDFCIATGTVDPNIEADDNSNSPLIAATGAECKNWAMKSFANIPENGWLNSIAYSISPQGSMIIIASGAYHQSNYEYASTLLVMSKDKAASWVLIPNNAIKNIPDFGVFESASGIMGAANRIGCLTVRRELPACNNLWKNVA